jgi:MYXO-CTERM domain-containing protein
LVFGLSVIFLKHHVGDIGENYYNVDYFYTLRVDSTKLNDVDVAYDEPIDFDDLPNDSLHRVVLDVEVGIGSYLLQESDAFKTAPCKEVDDAEEEEEDPALDILKRRRRQKQRQLDDVSKKQSPSSPRQLQNVGLTIGPDDQVVATCESNEESVLCYWVAGFFQVYTVGDDLDETESINLIKSDIQTAMDSGDLNDAHDAIVDVTYMDSLPSNTADEATSGEPDGNDGGDTISASGNQDGGSNTGVIVGASVGAVLLVAAVALVSRRRRNSILYEEQTEFQPSSMDVSEFHVSKEESVVGGDDSNSRGV